MLRMLQRNTWFCGHVPTHETHDHPLEHMAATPKSNCDSRALSCDPPLHYCPEVSEACARRVVVMCSSQHAADAAAADVVIIVADGNCVQDQATAATTTTTPT